MNPHLFIIEGGNILLPSKQGYNYCLYLLAPFFAGEKIETKQPDVYVCAQER